MKPFLKIWLALIVTALFVQSTSAQRPIEFENLSINEGLSQTIIFSITQDKNGYMWFGTEDGLNRFDGYDFKVLRNRPGDDNSIAGNNVATVFEDSKGRLWIGTYGAGLDILDHETGKLRHYARETYANMSTGSKGQGFNGRFIICIYEDSKGIVWVGTHSGLNRYDPSTGEFVHFQHNKEDPTSAPVGKLHAIVEDHQGNLWVASQHKGLTKFDRETEKFTAYPYDEGDPDGISSDLIIVAFVDSKENLWIGTYGGGLNRTNLATLDPDAETIKFEHYKHDPNDPFSISADWIASIHEDPKGNLWIGTHGGGLNKLDVKTGDFYRYQHDDQKRYSLADNTIYAMYEDNFGVLWFGTREGISKYEPLADKFIAYRHDPNDVSSISSDGIGPIVTGDDGTVWLGTSGEGLNNLDLTTGISKRYVNEPGNPWSLHSDNVGALARDSQGRIWIGSNETGLCRYDPKEDRFTTHARYELACKGCLAGNRVRSMMEDTRGNIWLASMKGLMRLEKESDSITALWETMEGGLAIFSGHTPSSFLQTNDSLIYIGLAKAGFGVYNLNDETTIHYRYDAADSTSLPDDRVRCIVEANDGIMWLGTMGGGLIKYDREKETFKTWRMPDQSRSTPEQEDGLPNDIVYGILEDDHGNLWMSTNNGISKFNPADESFRNYDVADGLQSNEFSSYSYHKSASGLMFFGGIKGFNVFHPDSIRDIQTIPQMVINKFSVFNQEVMPGEGKNPRLNKPINSADTLFLSYKDYVFSFEFAALHYVIPHKNQYAYKMVGFEEEWNYVGTRRFATYTNLDPGAYTFTVKGSNCDGIWNEEGKSIYIIISPPFWKTWWFKALSFIVIVSGIMLYIKLREATLKRQRRILKEQVHLKTQQLRKQTEELEEKNKDITDSIEYASTIQNAILPNTEEIGKALADHFVFFIPRDIVSGDFYWFAEKKDKIFIAACDCTGHGVPGAFLSMIGNDLLNQFIIEKDMNDPGEILTELNRGIQSVFTRKGSDKESQDGMDMTLAVLDKGLSFVEFAGAQNSMFLFRKSDGKEDESFQIDERGSGYRYKEVKGNLTPIGGRTALDYEFTNYRVELNKGDAIYLFSDGILDQFGGKKNKKFTKGRFRSTLFEIQPLPMKEQYDRLETRFEGWMGDFEQIDDVLVIGVKV